MTILTVIIATLRFLDYNAYEVYQWPEDEFTSVREVRFVTAEDLSGIEKGDFACFVFDEISPKEVCGTVRANVKFGYHWVTMDI